MRFIEVGPQPDCKAVTRNHLRGRASRAMRLRRTPHAPSFWQPRSTPVGAMLPSNAPRHVPPRRTCGRAPKGSRETLGYLDRLVHRTWRWPLGIHGDDLAQEDDVPSIIARTLRSTRLARSTPRGSAASIWSTRRTCAATVLLPAFQHTCLASCRPQNAGVQKARSAWRGGNENVVS